MRAKKEYQADPMQDQTPATLSELEQLMQNDTCFGKLHDTTDTTCLYCSVVEHCGTVQGLKNHDRLRSAKPKNKTYLDQNMYIESITKVHKDINSMPISTQKYRDIVAKHVKEAAESGEPYTVDELCQILRTDYSAINTFQLILWLSNFYSDYGLVVVDTKITIKQQ